VCVCDLWISVHARANAPQKPQQYTQTEAIFDHEGRGWHTHICGVTAEPPAVTRMLAKLRRIDMRVHMALSLYIYIYVYICLSVYVSIFLYIETYMHV